MKIRLVLVAVASALAIVALFALRDNIAERKTEAKTTVFEVVDVDEQTTDPAVWSRNFPRQYDSYRRTVDMERTRFGGSEADPFAVGADSIHKTTSRLEQDPRLKTMWNGYAFATSARSAATPTCCTTSRRPSASCRSPRWVPACTATPRSRSPTARRAWPPAPPARWTIRC
jgi:hypothetical protein